MVGFLFGRSRSRFFAFAKGAQVSEWQFLESVVSSGQNLPARGGVNIPTQANSGLEWATRLLA